MSERQHFIFRPGVWRGEGKITFSMADDELDFTMEWTVLPCEEGVIALNQEIAITGFPDKMRNHFTLSSLKPEKFHIVLENPIVTRVEGEGLLTSESVAWEFRRTDQAFEGFEIYALREDGSYKVRAEFTSGDDFRTKVQGRLYRE